MISDIHLDPTKRHDFVFLFDVENANPNGDPDAGNLPRVDPETMRGFTTDVSIKRKVRDYLQLTHGIPMFIQSETALNRLILDAAKKEGAEPCHVELDDSPDNDMLLEWLSENPINGLEIDNHLISYSEARKEKEIKSAFPQLEDGQKKKTIQPLINKLVKDLAKSVAGQGRLGEAERKRTRERMIQDYFDIRMFGAVLSTGLNAGQVRGPVQLTFTKSLDPIFRMDCGITRKAVTREQDRKTKENTMARKPIVSYGLYRGFGFYNPYLAQKTQRTELVSNNLFVKTEDLNHLWEALWKGFDNDHSASRHIRPRGLYVFTHNCARGNAPSHRLFDMLKVELRNEVKDRGASPSQFNDYKVSMPSGKLTIGSQEVTISCVGSNKAAESFPEDTVVFTKIYHEEEPTD